MIEWVLLCCLFKWGENRTRADAYLELILHACRLVAYISSLVAI